MYFIKSFMSGVNFLFNLKEQKIPEENVLLTKGLNCRAATNFLLNSD